MNLMRNIIATVVVLALADPSLADVILIDDFNDGLVAVTKVPTSTEFHTEYGEDGYSDDQTGLQDVHGGVRGWGISSADKGNDPNTDLEVHIYINDDAVTYGLWEVIHKGNPEAGSTIYVQYGGLCDAGEHWHENWNAYDRFRFYVDDFNVDENGGDNDDLQYFLKIMTGPDTDETFYKVYGFVEPEADCWYEIMFEDLLEDGTGNSLINDLDDVDGLKFAIEAGQDSEYEEHVFVGRLEVTPEPGTLVLLMCGGYAALMKRRKR